jgi:PPOX class probable F420-dependent enzyme
MTRGTLSGNTPTEDADDQRGATVKLPGMTDVADFAALVGRDHGLCVVSTLRAAGTIQSSVVNAGVLGHPVTGALVVAFTTQAGTAKLVNLRSRPRASIVVRAGWEWAAAEGPVQIAGPDDPLPGVDPEGLRVLLRDVFTAAGGTHDDWPTYDRVMAEERRAVVMITPERVYSSS